MFTNRLKNANFAVDASSIEVPEMFEMFRKTLGNCLNLIGSVHVAPVDCVIDLCNTTRNDPVLWFYGAADLCYFPCFFYIPQNA